MYKYDVVAFDISSKLACCWLRIDKGELSLTVAAMMSLAVKYYIVLNLIHQLPLKVVLRK